jgi:NAD(P)-dependent dehydrogenase (short-subunit alcohol dehydrogenase family)
MPTVLVTGANRGLGLEFARQYAADGWSVVATARKPDESGELKALPGDLSVEALDVRDFDAVASLADRLGGRPIDVLIANAGTSGPQRIESAADSEAWLETFAVNSVAPVRLAFALLGSVEAARGKLVAITSKMGSIEDNGSGGYIAYRSSKAALNAAWKSLSIDVAGRGVVAAVLHPGWVQTRMGGAAAPLRPPESVAGLRRVIATLTPAQSGGFFNHDGTPIPW